MAAPFHQVAGSVIGDTRAIVAELERRAEVEAAEALRKKGRITHIREANVRDTLPDRDLGLSVRDWVFDLSGVTAAGEQTVIDIELPDDKAIVFYGVKVVDQGTATYLAFHKGPAEDLKEYVLLDKVDPETGLIPLRPMVVYEPRSRLVVKIYVTGPSRPKLVLLAKTAEPAENSILG